MSVHLTWAGLTELREALRRLPEDLTGEASHLVEASTNAAAVAIKGGYPARTGNLRDHVSTEFSRTGLSVVGRVKSTSPHAYIFENGTQARHTAIGANRGAMPPGHVFLPAVIRERRRMYADLTDLLERHGLLVTGDA